MTTNFGNIPTTYAGTRFRSRLEARWAAFFDLVKWRWEYEPFDLQGYIPDFVLTPEEQPPVLVEVKPDLTIDALKNRADKIWLSGWNGEILIVGARMFPGDTFAVIGDNLDLPAGGTLALDRAVAFSCISCGAISFRSEAYAHRCRLCGALEGHVGSLDDGDLEGIWRAAGTRVQWRAA